MYFHNKINTGTNTVAKTNGRSLITDSTTDRKEEKTLLTDSSIPEIKKKDLSERA